MFLRHAFTLIVLLALLIPAFSVVSAQGDGDLTLEEQALIERVRAAILATDEYPAGVTITTATYINDVTINLGDTAYPGIVTTASTMTHTFTRDADGLPNSIALVTYDVAEDDANGNVQTYYLNAEIRKVGGAVYVLATRNPAEDDALDPMPDGWLQATATIEDDWPALIEIPLADWLREAEHLAVIDPDQLIVLDYVTHAALDGPVTLDDGIEANAVHIEVTGEALSALMTTMRLETGGADLSTVYAQLTAASRWDTTFWLDADGRIVQYEFAIFTELADIDLVLLAPDAPPVSRFTQIQTYTLRSTITVFDTPIDPVAAPEIAAPD